MRFFHLSDLHLGKAVNGFSMIEDQKYILSQILELVRQEKPEAVLIAGDVYDRSVPSEEAVGLLDDFLAALSDLETEILLISGNHDSAGRLAFGGRLMRKNIHVSPVYRGKVEPVTLEDAWGPVDFYLLPFLKPALVRPWLPEEEITSYTDALAAAIRQMQPDPARRNVLLAHQFVTGAARSDSEELSVGGTDNVDASVFDPFDYAALGHIHGPQYVGRPGVRYCGTPLKYSFSELRQQKSVTLVTLEQKGSLTLRTLPLTPLRDWAEIRGSFEELTALETRGRFERVKGCYLRVVLTDEEDPINAAGQLRRYYPYLMNLDYDNARTRATSTPDAPVQPEKRPPLELFGELYALQNGRELDEEQRGYLAGMIEELQEECP